MIFKVSDNFKGSCVLPTINKAIWAKMTVSITGNDLRAGDIKDAVRKGILIPVDEDYDHDAIEKDHDVIIINNTDRVLVLGQTALRPNGSLPISKDDAKIPEIIAAEADGIVTILSDEDEETYVTIQKETKKKETKKKVVKKKAKKKVVAKKAKKKVVKKAEEQDYIAPETGEDKDPVATTWDFRAKKSVKAIKIPKSEDFIKVGDDEREDVGFIDGEEEDEVKVKKTSKKTKKKATKKKTSKKKASVKKTNKKETKGKSKKVNTLQPVGEKRLPKTAMDAIMELDSRGNPIGDKPGETLRHLIDSIDAPKDVGFVDNEQSLDRYKKRTDME
jgi:uncharacterized protein YdbL (DUF1318 family)